MAPMKVVPNGSTRWIIAALTAVVLFLLTAGAGWGASTVVEQGKVIAVLVERVEGIKNDLTEIKTGVAGIASDVQALARRQP